MQINNIVISGYYGFNNAGDEAMLFSILQSLKKEYPNSDVTVISGNPKSTTNIFGVKSIFRFKLIEIFKELINSQLLISGGGSLLQDVTSSKSIYYYLSIIFLGILCKCKVFLYAQGIGPVKNKFTKIILKWLLLHTDCITVRDEESYRFLKKLGINKNLFLTADAVLALDKVSLNKGKSILKKANIDETKPKIGICVRNWMDASIWTKKIGELLSSLSDYELIFIPMQYPEDFKIGKKIDSYNLSNVTHLNKNYEIEELMSIIGNMDVLIGVRLHALIFATIMNVPVIGISYDPKINNFLKSINEDLFISLNDFDTREIYNKIKEKLATDKEYYNWSMVDNLKKNARLNAKLLKLVTNERSLPDEQINF